MKKILYKTGAILFLAGLVYPNYVNAREYQEATFNDFRLGLQEDHYYENKIAANVGTSLQSLEEVFPMDEPPNIIVDAKIEYAVEQGTIIDEAFIKEKVIEQITISDDKIAKDQVDIAILSRLDSALNQQQITYSVSGLISENLLVDNDFLIQKELKVTFEDAELTANPKIVTTNLGIKYDEFDLYTFVQEVKLGNQNLTEDDYSVVLKDTIPTDTTGQKK